MRIAVEPGPWDRMLAHLRVAVVAELGRDPGPLSFPLSLHESLAVFERDPGGGSLLINVDGAVVDVQVPALVSPVEVEFDHWAFMQSALFLAVVDASPSEAAAANVLGMTREKMATFARLNRLLVR